MIKFCNGCYFAQKRSFNSFWNIRFNYSHQILLITKKVVQLFHIFFLDFTNNLIRMKFLENKATCVAIIGESKQFPVFFFENWARKRENAKMKVHFAKKRFLDYAGRAVSSAPAQPTGDSSSRFWKIWLLICPKTTKKKRKWIFRINPKTKLWHRSFVLVAN